MGLLDWLRGSPPPVAGPPVSLPPAPTPADIVAALDGVESLATSSQLPGVLTSRVRHVTRTVREILPRMANAGLTSADEYALVATATDYLPEALTAYLRLPRDWADSRPVEGPKTSLLLLVDQLDLLGATVDKMYDAVCQADANALVVHGRFLQEKFGHPAPAQPAGPTPTRIPTSHNPLDLP